MTIGYSVTFTLAVLLLVAYILMVKEKEFWLSMLYICVAVVNLGYLLLSVSSTVEFAIFANDVSYFGSVFLSMCMFLTIVRLCGFEITGIHVIVCTALAVAMFALVATSGFLPWYYESVSLESVGSSTRLVKEYGPWHVANTVYLSGYVIAMIITILYSMKQKKTGSRKLAGLIAGIVCMNVAVWACQKFIDLEFEFLSITYLVSELVLLFVWWMMQDYVHKNDLPSSPITRHVVVVSAPEGAHQIEALLSRLPEGEMLTKKELEILEELIDGKSRKEIAALHHISENTVKTHVAHVYDKLGVSSKNELLSLLHKK